MVKKGLLFSVLLALTCTLPSLAQDIGSINFRDINVDELTESEIRQINREVEDRGLTMQQFEQLARAQGADQARIRRLMSRMQEVRIRGEATDGQRLDRERPTGETRFMGDLEDRTFNEMEGDTLSDSLRVFGSDLFNKVSMSFEPSFNIPTPEDYRVGPGDQLV
ncbi:MAG: hypothetical protein WD317_07075, partial [Balneolaceae bacterium]